jgi:hypothetical protein
MTANGPPGLPITKRACDAATPKRRPDGRLTEFTLWDGGRTGVRGFGLRVSKGGVRSFVLMFRDGRGRAAVQRKLTIGAYGSPWTVEPGP